MYTNDPRFSSTSLSNRLKILAWGWWMVLTMVQEVVRARSFEQRLGAVLDDLSSWFERGLLLLDHCPETEMAQDQQLDLRDHLEQARNERCAATSLRQAAPIPMALEMETLAPWHQLMLSVWNLSAAMRRHGVTLPRWASAATWL